MTRADPFLCEMQITSLKTCRKMWLFIWNKKTNKLFTLKSTDMTHRSDMAFLYSYVYIL